MKKQPLTRNLSFLYTYTKHRKKVKHYQGRGALTSVHPQQTSARLSESTKSHENSGRDSQYRSRFWQIQSLIVSIGIEKLHFRVSVSVLVSILPIPGSQDSVSVLILHVPGSQSRYPVCVWSRLPFIHPEGTIHK